jgi:plasmid maintenance system antidote protein VapI
MRPYKKLRAEMVLKDIQMGDLAKMLKLDPSTISLKLSGKRIITMWEMYRIVETLGIDKGSIAEYFPPELAVPNFSARGG